MDKKIEYAPRENPSAYERSRPFVFRMGDQIIRLTRGEVSRLWCEAEVALNAQENDEQADRCNGCGEQWPCSDSKRTDISGVERAKHFIGSR